MPFFPSNWLSKEFKMFWFLYFLGFFDFTKTITVTWTRPDEPPTSQKQILAALERHLFALEAAQYASKLLSLDIKLCPQAEFDPLIGEFTIPRMIAYSKYYDHDCVIGHDPSLKWWGKDKEPPPTTSPSPPKKVVGEGLAFGNFLWKLRSSQDKQESDEVWLLDSDSLRSWFKGRLLYSLTDPAMMTSSHAHLLLKQLNVMNGPDGEKDLKRMPQAVQGALVVVLPSYGDWKPTGNLFDATWFKSAILPTQEQVKAKLQLLLKSQAGNLTIIVHEPTKEAADLITQLQLTFGGDKIVSVSKVLPNGYGTLTLLKFIQKAAKIAVDNRDTLGRIALLSRGSDDGILTSNYGRTMAQNAVLAFSIAIVLVGIFTLVAWVRFNYQASLKDHLIRFAIIKLVVLFGLVTINLSWWPKKLVYFWYGVFDCEIEALFYGLISMYLMAGFVTLLVWYFEKPKYNQIPSSEAEDDIYLAPRYQES